MSRNSGQKGDSGTLLPMTVESAMESFYKDENSCWKKMNGLLSCLIFSFCSIVMVLLNKYITTAVDINYRDNMPNIFIVWFQCVLAVVILQARTVQQWLPINLLFIGMLVTSFMSFIHLSVPMITIIKNLVNVASLSTILAIILIIIGAVMSGLHDLHFHLLGYLYTLLNVLCTTAYILYMRHASAHVKLSKIEMEGLAFITLGTLGGMLYGWSKLPPSK
eukprot:gene25688-31022_t